MRWLQAARRSMRSRMALVRRRSSISGVSQDRKTGMVTAVRPVTLVHMSLVLRVAEAVSRAVVPPAAGAVMFRAAEAVGFRASQEILAPGTTIGMGFPM